MALEEKIEAIDKIGKALKKQPIEDLEALERVSPDKEHFQSLLNQGQEQPYARTTVSLETEKVSSVSLMDEINKLNSQVSRLKRLTPEEVRNQAQDIVVSMEKVKVNLDELNHLHAQASNLQGKEIADAALSPQQRRMQQRLTHIDESLKIALSKAGVEYQAYVPQPEPTGRINPVKSFVGLLTNSQAQLDNLGNTIAELQLSKAELNPVNMLAIQMKINIVQQQLELFTGALNKALESMKTLMNVQV
jgi:hypothetical protein